MAVMRTRHPLDVLLAGLRGQAVEGADWRSVISIANRTLLTPALYSSMAASGQTDRLPSEVDDYLRFIHDSNCERNRRLRTQLHEAVAALNGGGIIPLLLKGAVILFESADDQVPSRIASDLDLGVELAEEAAARCCLQVLGYVPVPRDRGLMRPQDAAVLEIRASGAECGGQRARTVECHGLQVRIPSAQSRILHWMIHDLVKEGDYWRGRIDLRHLHDLAQLAQTNELDWAALRKCMSDLGARDAFDTQLLALHYFFGIQIPMECAARPMARLQHWRRAFTARHRVIGAPLRLAGNLAWGTSRLFRSGAVTRGGPAHLARRIRRTLLDDRSRI